MTAHTDVVPSLRGRSSMAGGGDNERAFVEALVEESPDALIALRVDGSIAFWNRGAEIIFGYTRAEALGNQIADLLVPPHLVDQDREALARALAEGAASFEGKRRRKDGALVDV